MENMLILRTANYAVIDKLVNYIYSNYKEHNIYMIVQKDSLDNLRTKYIDIKFIAMESNKFDYISFKKDKKLIHQIDNLKFKLTFVPSSMDDFVGFFQVSKILSFMNMNEVVLFNKNEEVCTKKINNSLKLDFIDKISCFINKVNEYKVRIHYHIKINKNIW